MNGPNRKEGRRFGVQAALNFDPETVNASVYDIVKKIVQGSQGLGSSGGTLANKLSFGNGFEESHVFMEKKTSMAVQQRLEQRTTESLQKAFGKQAKAQNTSIPDYLQSQGVRGIFETASGNLSAYKQDNFKHISQNPVTGSNERKTKALIEKMGGKVSISGGHNEGRRNDFYLREPQAKTVRAMTDRVYHKTKMGDYNFSNTEAHYADAAGRERAKTLYNSNRNESRALNFDTMDPAAVAEIESRQRAQYAKKNLTKDVTAYMQEKGDLPAPVPVNPMEDMKAKVLKSYEQKRLKELAISELRSTGDIPEEDKSGSGKGVIQKGAAIGIQAISSTLGVMKTMVGSVLSVLTKISMDMGRLIQDSAEVGVDVNTADAMRKWGIGNPTYSGGNPLIQMDAVKAFQNKAGDVTRVGGINFDPMAFHGYGALIKSVVEASVNQSPLEGTKTIYNSMANTYMNAGSEKQKSSTLKNQISALSTSLGPAFASGYSTMLRASEEQGLINKDNAGNMWDINMNPKNLDKLNSIGGSNVNEFIPGAAGAMDLAGNTKMLNDVLGDVGKIQNALYMMLLSNMDIIIQILLGIAKGLLGLAVTFSVKGAAEGLARLEKAESGMAKKGQINLDTNVAKAELSAKAEIRNNLKKKGLEGDELDAMTDAAFAGGSKGDLSGIPEKYRGSVTGSVATKLAVFNTGKKKSKEGYNDTMHGSFWTSGLLGNLFQDSASEQKSLLSKLGLGEYNPTEKNISSIEDVVLGYDTTKKIVHNAFGVGAKREDSLSDTTRLIVYLASGIALKKKTSYKPGIYPDEEQGPKLDLSGTKGDASTDLGGLPFIPKPKDSLNFSGMDFSSLSGLTSDFVSKSAQQAFSAGTTLQKSSLADATVRIELVQKEKVIGSNVITLAGENQLRSYMRANIGSG